MGFQAYSGWPNPKLVQRGTPRNPIHPAKAIPLSTRIFSAQGRARRMGEEFAYLSRFDPYIK